MTTTSRPILFSAPMVCALALRPGHGWDLMRWCGAAALRLQWMQLPPIPEGAS